MQMLFWSTSQKKKTSEGGREKKVCFDVSYEDKWERDNTVNSLTGTREKEGDTESESNKNPSLLFIGVVLVVRGANSRV